MQRRVTVADLSYFRNQCVCWAAEAEEVRRHLHGAAALAEWLPRSIVPQFRAISLIFYRDINWRRLRSSFLMVVCKKGYSMKSGRAAHIFCNPLSLSSWTSQNSFWRYSSPLSKDTSWVLTHMSVLTWKNKQVKNLFKHYKLVLWWMIISCIANVWFINEMSNVFESLVQRNERFFGQRSLC